MDSFAANYIKPRGSNLTNMNASLITNKRQAQMVFTGYARQIEAIDQGVKTLGGAVVFSGADGPALNNLKNGNTWTSPETLNAIQTTNYCEVLSGCNIVPQIPNYEIHCNNTVGVTYLELDSIQPFNFSYNENIQNTGIVQFFFYEPPLAEQNPNVVGTQVIVFNVGSQLVVPVPATTWTTVGYVFRCTPLVVSYSDFNVGALEPGYPYSFLNDSGNEKTLRLRKNLTEIFEVLIFNDGNYTPTPTYGWDYYEFL